MKETDKKEQEIEIFVQAEGVTEFLLVKTYGNRTLTEIIKAQETGLPNELREAADLCVTRENDENEIPLNKPVSSAGIKHRDRIHVNRCRRIKVTVNFNHETMGEQFPPSTTVAKVKKRAVKEFGIDEQDSTEHALQICGTVERPNEDTHVGSLTRKGQCSVCFDLVPKKRVEG